MKPRKSIKNKKLNEKKVKGLCFWCDENLYQTINIKTRNYTLYVLLRIKIRRWRMVVELNRRNLILNKLPYTSQSML